MILGTRVNYFVIGLLMITASAAGNFLKPTAKLSDSRPSVNLEKIIPEQFGEWHKDPVELEQIITPERKELIAKIYNQTLTRSYLDSHGSRIMLSIAYGGDPSTKEMRVHRPEICYPAQGFQVEKQFLDTLATKFGTLPIKRLIAVQGSRNEPITYWITMGDKALVQKGLQQKFAQLRFGLTGKVPDGMLVRISSINRDDKEAYQMQDNFIREMLAAMSKDDRERISGNFEE
jgi:EpsI family protein